MFLLCDREAFWKREQQTKRLPGCAGIKLAEPRCGFTKYDGNKYDLCHPAGAVCVRVCFRVRVCLRSAVSA